MRTKVLQILWHSKDPVFSLDFHPNGLLVTAGQDKEIMVRSPARPHLHAISASSSECIGLGCAVLCSYCWYRCANRLALLYRVRSQLSNHILVMHCSCGTWDVRRMAAPRLSRVPRSWAVTPGESTLSASRLQVRAQHVRSNQRLPGSA